MKIVIAIDSFKGSLSSLEASRAAKAGIEKVCYAARTGREESGPGRGAGNEAADEIAYWEIERNMVIKYGPHGKFLACPGFPECRNTFRTNSFS